MRPRVILAAALLLLLFLLVGLISMLNDKPRARTVQLAPTTTTSSGLQITIDTRFIDSPMIEKLLEQSGERWLPREKSAERWPRFLDNAERSKFLALAAQDKQTSTVTAPRLTLESGKSSYVLVSRQSAYVKDLNLVNGQSSFEPVIDIIDSGVRVECLATLAADGKSVTLKLQPRVTTLREFTTQPWRGSPTHSVQIPHISEIKLDTTISMPLDATAVFRVTPVRTPATVPATVPTTQPDPAPKPVLIFVCPTLSRASVVQTRPAKASLD